MGATPWKFESSRPHQPEPPFDEARRTQRRFARPGAAPCQRRAQARPAAGNGAAAGPDNPPERAAAPPPATASAPSPASSSCSAPPPRRGLARARRRRTIPAARRAPAPGEPVRRHAPPRRRPAIDAFLLQHEPAVRLAAFLGAFAAVALAERAAPRRPPSAPRARRWAINIALAALNAAALRFAFAAGAVGAAQAADAAGFGLFNRLAWPAWLEFACAMLLLDLAIYFQHALFHAVPGLWRLHKVHHSDTDMDVTAGARFHVIEIFLSMALKIAVAGALGAPAAAVVAFEIALNASAMFNHGNLALPARLDGALRRVIVTPDMHRIHHSALRRETDSNFGFCLSCWDRLFGTYRPRPRDGHESMTIGLAEFRDPAQLGLPALLAMPFARPPRPPADR